LEEEEEEDEEVGEFNKRQLAARSLLVSLLFPAGKLHIQKRKFQFRHLP